MSVQIPDISNLAACPGCDLLYREVSLAQGKKVHCPRCGTTLRVVVQDSVDKTLALSLTGLLLFIPAMTLPIMTLTASIMAHMTRMTRTAVLNVTSSSYIEMAILKGVPRLQIVLKHALLNALSPIFNVVALNLAYLISGVVIVETVFAYPGIAKLMVDAVSTRDIPLVQACAMLFCGTYVGLNLLADLFSILSNPRLRIPK